MASVSHGVYSPHHITLSEKEKGFFAKEYKASLDKKERQTLESEGRKEVKKEEDERVSSVMSIEILLSMSLSKKRSATEETRVLETQAGGGPKNDNKTFMTVSGFGTGLGTH